MRRWLVVAFGVYVGAIVVANWLIVHVGTPAGPGTHLLPVGFGLMAPSGTYLAAVTFPARDVVQRLGGRWFGVAAIVIGAGVSYLVSSPTIAFASGATFLVSESADFAVYSPLQRRWFAPAVVASGVVALVVDSVLFLRLAHIPMGSALPGLLVAKAYVVALAGPVAAWLRRRPALAVAR